tara:strand:+ start:596 stop:1207 length:612 start_codon:yes stop_codon:yes gene_type:complete
VSLKQKNYPLIVAYSLLQMIFFMAVILGVDVSSYNLDDLLKPGVVSISVFLVSVLLLGILPDGLKASLVFWRLKNPLPGNRAFSHHAQNDPRIDINTLINKHEELPRRPADQNRLWYQIYKKHEKEERIANSHKEYLLTRDITQLSFFYLILFGMAAGFVFNVESVLEGYISILALVFVLSALAARNYGIRFVTNVLAIDCHT